MQNVHSQVESLDEDGCVCGREIEIDRERECEIYIYIEREKEST